MTIRSSEDIVARRKNVISATADGLGIVNITTKAENALLSEIDRKNPRVYHALTNTLKAHERRATLQTHRQKHAEMPGFVILNTLQEVTMQQYNMKPFDFSALLNIQRKNMEAISEASKVAMEGFQTVVQRQTELITQLAKDTSSMLQDLAKEGTAAERAVVHSDLVQKTYEKSVKNWHELAGIVDKSSKEASAVVHDRVASSLTELKSALHKGNGKDSTHKKAA